MAKKLEQFIKEKKITSVTALNKHLKGKTVVIVTPPASCGHSGHNYGSIGTKIKIEQCYNYYHHGGARATVQLRTGGTSIYVGELEVLGGTMEDLKAERGALTKRILDAQKDIEEIDGKIKYLTDNGLTEYDEELFRVMDMLKVIDDKGLDQMARAKAVMSLLQ